MPAADIDPSYLPAHRLAAEIAARHLSPVAVVEALLARIAAHDAKLHAFIAVVFFYAPAVAARAAGRRFDYHEAGLRLHPFGLNLKVLGGASLLFFPAFIGGFFVFYGYTCGPRGAWLAPS